jgi:inner membrane protein
MWFNHGFVQAQVIDHELVLTDLRLGREPDYIFSFVVAERSGATWRAIPPRELRSAFRAPIPAGGLRTALADLWTRIWQTPVSERNGSAP